MPLSRAREEILVDMNGVNFLMKDGAVEVLCRATSDLLLFRFDSAGECQGKSAFHKHRVAIEQAAIDKYEACCTQAGADPQVIVTLWDMSSPLSRKM
jgi:hypothetical protein